MKTKVFIISLFFILTLMISMIIVNNVFAQDEYGNHLWTANVYQHAQDVGSFNNVTYSEGMNITIDNYLWDDFMFYMLTRVNTTVIGEGGYVSNYQGVGIQIYDEDLNSVYASGIAPSPPRLFDPEPFETIDWMSEIIELDLYKTINYINITLWHNYEMTGNYSDYEVTESWKFNLVAENYGYTPPPEDETAFFDFYLLGLLLCVFIFPLSIAGTIKMKNPKLLRITFFSGVVLVICFVVLMDIKFV